MDTSYSLEAKFSNVVEILRAKLSNRLVWTLFIAWAQSNYYSLLGAKVRKSFLYKFEPNGQNFRENITNPLIFLLAKFCFIKPEFFSHL